MKIFLDSVDLNQIQKYQDMGIIDGITTNPSLMAGAKYDLYETVRRIRDVVQGDISVEVIATDLEDMKKEGDKILQISDQIVIKLPMTWSGLQACSYFSSKGHKVNMTLCFSSNQAFLAAKCGASYISPFIGRLEDKGENGIELISHIKTIYNNYNFKTEILAASIRSTEHVKEVLLIGADVVTLPAKILSELVEHQLTDIGLKQFTEDWNKSGKKI
ncbi:MAG: fructose-6-phosphate aldolase [Rickettsiaceae bacterium]|nr:fructose-6-phosphate aldolase [Rickettsiaceae bacterium]